MTSHSNARSAKNKLHRDQIFGALTVIRSVLDPNFTYQANRDRSSPRRSTAWYLVKCTCGVEERLRRFEIMHAAQSCRHIAVVKPVKATRHLKPPRPGLQPKLLKPNGEKVKVFDAAANRFVTVDVIGSKEATIQLMAEQARLALPPELPTPEPKVELDPVTVASIKALLQAGVAPEVAAQAYSIPVALAYEIQLTLALAG